MRKCALYLAAVLWMIALIQAVIMKNEKTEEAVVEAIEACPFETVETQVNVFGEYKGGYLSEEQKEVLLREIAGKLGLTQGYEISSEREEQRAQEALTKSGKYADTAIRMITLETKMEAGSHVTQYLEIGLTLHNREDTAFTYQRRIGEIASSYGINNTVTINTIGTAARLLSAEEKNEWTDKLLKQCEARVVTENRTEELFSVYAYTGLIEDSVKVSGKKMNLNLATMDDEVRGKTCFYISTPVNNIEY